MSTEEIYECPGCGGTFRVLLRERAASGAQDWDEGTVSHELRIERMIVHEGRRGRRSGSANPECVTAREQIMREVAARDSALLRSIHSMLDSAPPLRHEHDWAEDTRMADPDRLYVCPPCGATRTETRPKLDTSRTGRDI